MKGNNSALAQVTVAYTTEQNDHTIDANGSVLSLKRRKKESSGAMYNSFLLACFPPQLSPLSLFWLAKKKWWKGEGAKIDTDLFSCQRGASHKQRSYSLNRRGGGGGGGKKKKGLSQVLKS